MTPPYDSLDVFGQPLNPRPPHMHPFNHFHDEQDDYDSPSQQDDRGRPGSFVATQLSQSQQRRGGEEVELSSTQRDPKSKYWAIFQPLNNTIPELKLRWTAPQTPPDYPPSQSQNPFRPLGASGQLRVGRAPSPRYNDLTIAAKRVSNKHCRIWRLDEDVSEVDIDAVEEVGEGGKGKNGKVPEGEGSGKQVRWRVENSRRNEPVVLIEDLGSSNGTWVNSIRVNKRTVLTHGDEISLGAPGKMDQHDVRWIYKSVGRQGVDSEERIGEIFEKYHFLETLGTGSFAEVKKAVDLNTGRQVAIKCIAKHKFNQTPKMLQLFDREISILQTLHHPNICAFIEQSTDPQHIYLVLEYIDGGDLLNYIMQRGESGEIGLPEWEAIELTRQICLGMSYIHAMGVAHRDLKPENILLSIDENSPDNVPTVKIADFGLAKMVVEGTALRSMVGTPQYLAPEIVCQTAQKPGYEAVVDSWSVGVIVYSMLTNALPFDENPEEPVAKRITKRLTEGFDREMLFEVGLSEAGTDFIERLLEKDPARRMTLDEALQHPWLQIPNDTALHTADSDRWTRGSTVGLSETPRLGGSMYSDDLSQPINRLRLQTPGSRSARREHFSLNSEDGQLAGQSSIFGNGNSESFGDLGFTRPRVDPMDMEMDGGMDDEAGGDNPGARQNGTRTAGRAQVQQPVSLILQQSPPSPPLSDSFSARPQRNGNGNENGEGASQARSQLPAYVPETQEHDQGPSQAPAASALANRPAAMDVEVVTPSTNDNGSGGPGAEEDRSRAESSPLSSAPISSQSEASQPPIRHGTREVALPIEHRMREVTPRAKRPQELGEGEEEGDEMDVDSPRPRKRVATVDSKAEVGSPVGVGRTRGLGMNGNAVGGTRSSMRIRRK